MYVDRGLLLSNAQVLAQAVGTYNSANAVDLMTVGRDVGRGEPIYAVVVVDQAFASAGAATLAIQVVTADNAALTINTTVHVQTAPIAVAALPRGRVPIVLAIPPGIARRFLGLSYVIGGAATTTGIVTAFLAVDVQTNW